MGQKTDVVEKTGAVEKTDTGKETGAKQRRLSAAASHPFKGKVTRALEGEHPVIALGQHAVFRAGNVQLHPVAAFHLERGIV